MTTSTSFIFHYIELAVPALLLSCSVSVLNDQVIECSHNLAMFIHKEQGLNVVGREIERGPLRRLIALRQKQNGFVWLSSKS